MADLAVALLVFESGVREMGTPIKVRQVVRACPCRDLFWLAIRSPIAVGAPAVPFLQELPVLALQLVVEDDALDSCAAPAEALLRE